MLNDKKILLVHPLGYRADAAGRDISRIANIMPPLGLASIAAYLEQRGTGADIVDCYARPDSDRAIHDYLLAEQPSASDGSCDTCTYNSGVYLRTGYQVNFGRREAGEFIGVVVHRVHPKAIRGNVLWLDTGDEKFPGLRKKQDWNHVQIAFTGPRLQVTLNGTKICDVTDNPTDPSEAKWKEAGPISFQWPPAGEAGGFAGFVKYRNIRIREVHP